LETEGPDFWQYGMNEEENPKWQWNWNQKKRHLCRVKETVDETSKNKSEMNLSCLMAFLQLHRLYSVEW
jgi:hypothetical protein